jgi:hypothetical protein
MIVKRMTRANVCRVRAASAAFGFVGASASLPASLPAAQAPPIVSDAPTCAACRINVVRQFTLDVETAGALLEDWPIKVVMSSTGRIALVVKGGRGLPRLYTREGKLLRVLGREGRGPGEFVNAVGIGFGGGDTLHVFDLSTGRRSLFTQDGAFVRSMSYTIPSILVALESSGNTIVTSSNGDRFTVVNAIGNTVNTFGQQPRPTVGTRTPSTIISSSRPNQFWSAVSHTFVMERWSVEGQRLTVFARQGPWLKVGVRDSDGTYGQEPTPTVADVREDADGRLWLLANLPHANWRRGLGNVNTARGFAHFPDRDFGRLYESRIEVIDPERGRLLQSVVLPGYARFFLSDRHVASLRFDEDGDAVVDVYVVAFTQPNTRR